MLTMISDIRIGSRRTDPSQTMCTLQNELKVVQQKKICLTVRIKKVQTE